MQGKNLWATEGSARSVYSAPLHTAGLLYKQHLKEAVPKVATLLGSNKPTKAGVVEKEPEKQKRGDMNSQR